MADEPKVTVQLLNDQVMGRPVYHAPPSSTIKLLDWKDPFPLLEVIAVGPGVLLQDGSRPPLTVKPGDLVFTARVEAEQQLNGEVVCFTSESSIRGIALGEDRSKLTFGVSDDMVKATEEDAKLRAEAAHAIAIAKPMPQGHAWPPQGKRH